MQLCDSGPAGLTEPMPGSQAPVCEPPNGKGLKGRHNPLAWSRQCVNPSGLIDWFSHCFRWLTHTGRGCDGLSGL